MDDLSIRIELNDEDLLDIDGSDDQTLAYSARKFLRNLNKRSPFTRAVKPTPRESFSDIRETVAIPPKILAQLPPAKPAVAGRMVATVRTKKKSPTISPVPDHLVAGSERDVNGSYPPIAVSVRPPAMSFVSEHPSRAGWITAAVIGVLILLGGFIKVGAPKLAPAVAAEPPPAVAPQAAPAPTPAATEDKVVKFDDDQGVAIRSKEEASKPAAHAAKHVAARPAPAKPKTELTLGGSKPEPKEKPEPKKKALTIDQELADAQLRAAAR